MVDDEPTEVRDSASYQHNAPGARIFPHPAEPTMPGKNKGPRGPDGRRPAGITPRTAARKGKGASVRVEAPFRDSIRVRGSVESAL